MKRNIKRISLFLESNPFSVSKRLYMYEVPRSKQNFYSRIFIQGGSI